jgi:hypothetical protein
MSSSQQTTLVKSYLEKDGGAAVFNKAFFFGSKAPAFEVVENTIGFTHGGFRYVVYVDGPTLGSDQKQNGGSLPAKFLFTEASVNAALQTVRNSTSFTDRGQGLFYDYIRKVCRLIRPKQIQADSEMATQVAAYKEDTLTIDVRYKFQNFALLFNGGWVLLAKRTSDGSWTTKNFQASFDDAYKSADCESELKDAMELLNQQENSAAIINTLKEEHNAKINRLQDLDREALAKAATEYATHNKKLNELNSATQKLQAEVRQRLASLTTPQPAVVPHTPGGGGGGGSATPNPSTPTVRVHTTAKVPSAASAATSPAASIVAPESMYRKYGRSSRFDASRLSTAGKVLYKAIGDTRSKYLVSVLAGGAIEVWLDKDKSNKNESKANRIHALWIAKDVLRDKDHAIDHQTYIFTLLREHGYKLLPATSKQQDKYYAEFIYRMYDSAT